MRKIAIVTNGKLPIPNVKGGGVETLINIILEQNEKRHAFDFTVFSVINDEAMKASEMFKHSKFVYCRLKKDTIIMKMKRYMNRLLYGICTYPEPINFKEIATMISEDNYDIILIENTLQPLILFSKRFKEKVLLHLHNDWINEELDERYQKKIAKAINNSAGIVTISEYMKERIKSIKGIKNEKIRILKNAIDLQKYQIRINDRESVRKKMGIGEDEFVVLFCGRLVRQKGVTELIYAINNIPPKYNIKLLIAGEIEYEQPYSQKILEEARKALHPVVNLNYISHQKIPYLYKIADISVVPSIWEEPAGLTVLESMASEIPLITTYSGGIPEYTDRECAILCHKDERLIDELAQNIMRLYDNQQERERVINNAKKKVQEYTIENYYLKFQHIIENS